MIRVVRLILNISTIKILYLCPMNGRSKRRIIRELKRPISIVKVRIILKKHILI